MFTADLLGRIVNAVFTTLDYIGDVATIATGNPVVLHTVEYIHIVG